MSVYRYHANTAGRVTTEQLFTTAHVSTVTMVTTVKMVRGHSRKKSGRNRENIPRRGCIIQCKGIEQLFPCSN